jgi:hypothetical protein
MHVAAFVIFSEHVTEEQVKTYLDLLKQGGMLKATSIKPVDLEELRGGKVHFSIDL